MRLHYSLCLQVYDILGILFIELCPDFVCILAIVYIVRNPKDRLLNFVRLNKLQCIQDSLRMERQLVVCLISF